MMKRALLMASIATLMAGIAALMATSCQKEDIYNGAVADSDIVKINALIQPMNEADPSTRPNIDQSIRFNIDPSTRANIDQVTGKVAFATGDLISVYVTPEAMETKVYTMRYTGSEWVKNSDGKQLSWHEIGAKQARFTTFYPTISTQPGESYKHFMDPNPNMNIPGEAKEHDLLLASTEGSVQTGVRFDFKHAMSLVEINLLGLEGFSPTDLDKAQINMIVDNSVLISTVTGDYGEFTKFDHNYVFTNRGNGKFQAFVCPQNVKEQWRTDAMFTIKLGTHLIKYKAPESMLNGGNFDKLKPATRYTFNLTINKDGGSTTVEDVVWVSGLNGIPSLDKWGIAYSHMGTVGLKYEPEYGWYDIKKLDAISPAFDDHRMCWAATCTNMLHWWFDRNKENVECYLRYKAATDPDYVAPRINYNNTTHKDSDIFNFFKRTTLNKGGHVSQGLKWYLRGDWFSNPGDATSVEDTEESRKHQSQGGFFGEVYKDSPIEEIWQGRGSSHGAGEFYKAALRRGDALGICHQSMSGSHAITMWGAAFDKNGEITSIFVSDNNHSEAELNQGNGTMRPGKISPFGIFQMRIKRDSQNSEIYHLESSTVGTYGVNITGLESLSQGKDAWDRFWAKHPEYAPGR